MTLVVYIDTMSSNLVHTISRIFLPVSSIFPESPKSCTVSHHYSVSGFGLRGGLEVSQMVATVWT